MKTAVLLAVILFLFASMASAADGVFTLFAFDCSGSMNQQLVRVAAAQAAQVRLAIRKGDFVGRVAFSDRVRKDLLAEIRTPNDLANAATILNNPPEPGSGWTYISKGLAQAYELWQTQSVGRQSLLFIISDAVPATPSGMLSSEVKALKTEAAKWKAVRRCRIFLVAIQRGDNSGAVRWLGQQLGATVITPTELASTNLLAREVDNRHRAPEEHQERHPEISTPLALSSIAAILLLSCAVVGKVLFRPKDRTEIASAAENERDEFSWTGTLTAAVTVDGESELTKLALPNDDCPDGRVSFGPSGCNVRLPDAEFVILLGNSGVALEVPGSNPVSVDGVVYRKGEVAIGNSAEIVAGRAHVIVNLREGN